MCANIYICTHTQIHAHTFFGWFYKKINKIVKSLASQDKKSKRKITISRVKKILEVMEILQRK